MPISALPEINSGSAKKSIEGRPPPLFVDENGTLMRYRASKLDMQVLSVEATVLSGNAPAR